MFFWSVPHFCSVNYYINFFLEQTYENVTLDNIAQTTFITLDLQTASWDVDLGTKSK